MAGDATSPTPLRREPRAPEWRHRVESMSYRPLGATGMMISELVMGGIPITPETRGLARIAMEVGINYFDTASAYGTDSASERGLGALLRESPGLRDQIFLATKLSDFSSYRTSLYEDIFKGLPSEKQHAILKRAREIVEERGSGAEGVFFRYFPGQEKNLDWEYRIVAMQRDFGHRVEGSGRFRRKMLDTLDESLTRTGAGCYDVLHCPHGAATPEIVQEPEMLETLEEIRRSGRARFFGVSTHTAFEQVTRAVADMPTYDVVMGACNVLNQRLMRPAVAYAAERGLGVIAMKACAAVMTHFDELNPVAEWRAEKLHHAVPGEWTLPQKAYLFALNTPGVCAVTSNMWSEAIIRENVLAAGHKVTPNFD